MQFNLDKQFDSIPCSNPQNAADIIKAVGFAENKVSTDSSLFPELQYRICEEPFLKLCFFRFSTKSSWKKCTANWSLS